MTSGGGRSCATTRRLICCTRRCAKPWANGSFSSGSGLRRIDMVVGEAADELVARDRDLLSEMARSFNAGPEAMPERIRALRAELKEKERELARVRDQLQTARVGGGDGFAVKH